MRVLHVVDSLDSGGMENGVVNLSRGLFPRIDCHVACLTRRGAFADRLRDGKSVHVLGKVRGFSPRTIWRLARTIWRLRPEIVHTHNLGPLIYAALATAFGRTCSIVHGEHSQFAAEDKTPRRIRQRRQLYHACRVVHAVAPAIREELVRYGCTHRDLRVILNGVDTNRFSPGDRLTARRQLGLPADGLFLGMVGRFGQHKGHAIAMEAFSTLAQALPQVHLLIAGAGGPLETQIRELANHHPAHNRIHFTGLLENSATAFQALDLLIVPSTNEGMANVALESMACGTPVLGNRGCGHELMIESGVDGVIADLGNAPNLASEISTLLTCPTDLATLSKRARQKVESKFPLTGMLVEYDNLYHDVHKASGRGLRPAGIT